MGRRARSSGCSACRGPARDGYDSAGVSRYGPAPPAANPQAGTPPDETLRDSSNQQNEILTLEGLCGKDSQGS